MDKKQQERIDAILEDQAIISRATRGIIMGMEEDVSRRQLQNAEAMEFMQTMAGIMGASSAVITSLAGFASAASGVGKAAGLLAKAVEDGREAGSALRAAVEGATGDPEGEDEEDQEQEEDIPAEVVEEKKTTRKRKSRAKKKDPEPLPPLGEDGPADADDDGFGFTVTDETEDGVDDEFGFEADPEEPKKEAKAEAKVEKPAEPEFTLEIVRSKLAALCQVGLQPQVKQLITDAGAERITEVAPEKYAGIMEKAKELDTKAKAGKGVS